eukprot:5799708-Prymnesium_polylepis.1
MVSTHPSDLNTEAEKSDSFKGARRRPPPHTRATAHTCARAPLHAAARHCTHLRASISPMYVEAPTRTSAHARAAARTLRADCCTPRRTAHAARPGSSSNEPRAMLLLRSTARAHR